MDAAALIRTAPQIDMRSAMPRDGFATLAANDDVTGIEVIELEVVEIELRAGGVVVWGPM